MRRNVVNVRYMYTQKDPIPDSNTMHSQSQHSRLSHKKANPSASKGSSWGLDPSIPASHLADLLELRWRRPTASSIATPCPFPLLLSGS